MTTTSPFKGWTFNVDDLRRGENDTHPAFADPEYRRLAGEIVQGLEPYLDEVTVFLGAHAAHAAAVGCALATVWERLTEREVGA